MQNGLWRYVRNIKQQWKQIGHLVTQVIGSVSDLKSSEVPGEPIKNTDSQLQPLKIWLRDLEISIFSHIPGELIQFLPRWSMEHHLELSNLEERSVMYLKIGGFFFFDLYVGLK